MGRRKSKVKNQGGQDDQTSNTGDLIGNMIPQGNNKENNNFGLFGDDDDDLF